MLLVIPQEERVLFGIIHSSGEAPTLCSLTAHCSLTLLFTTTAAAVAAAASGGAAARTR